MNRFLLIAALLLPVGALAQDIVPAGPALPLLPTELREARSARFANCTGDEEVANTTAEFFLRSGNAATSTGTPAEFGQSFTAPCTGTVDSLFVVIQPEVASATRPAGSPGTAGVVTTGTITVYEGEGTAGTLLQSIPFSLSIPSGAAFIPFRSNVRVTEGGVYTFFLDVNAGGQINLQLSVVDPYLDGNYYFSTSGGPTPSTANVERDIVFAAAFAPNSVAAEGGAEGARISLSASTPNPVRSASMLSFSLESASTARVAVYDVLGREVSVIADGPYGAGSHDVRFDATALAPGAYVVRLVTNGSTVSRTVSVVR